MVESCISCFTLTGCKLGTIQVQRQPRRCQARNISVVPRVSPDLAVMYLPCVTGARPPFQPCHASQSYDCFFEQLLFYPLDIVPVHIMSSNSVALKGYLQPPPDGDQNNGPVLLGVTWAFTAICTVVVSLKIWTRFKIIGQTGMDDALTILALVRMPLLQRTTMYEADDRLTSFSSSHSLRF